MKHLQQYLEEAAHAAAISFHKGYTGRDMTNTPCVCIIGPRRMVRNVIADAITLMSNDLLDSVPGPDRDNAETVFDSFVNILLHHETGIQEPKLVYYWPELVYSEAANHL